MAELTVLLAAARAGDQAAAGEAFALLYRTCDGGCGATRR
jgi:hypothetical protein